MSAQGIGNPEQQFDIREIIDLALRYARGMWRFRWLGLALAWLGSLCAWTYVYLMPDEYEASTRVYVDTESLLRPLLSGLSVETDVMNDVTVMTRAMVSRPSLERVARQTDLDLRAQTPGEIEMLLESLEERIQIGNSRENIFNISFTDSDREMALAVVTALLDVFVDDTLGSKEEESDQAERTLQAQIDEYEKRLDEADARLKEFKQKNIGMMPDDRGDYYNQLQSAMGDLAAVRQRIEVAQRKRDALERQIAGEEPVLGIMTQLSPTVDTRVTSLDGQVTQMQQRLSELRLNYTDQHPEVVRTQSLLEELNERRAQELARIPASSSTAAANPLDANPVYQNLRIQLSNAEVDLASLNAELAQRQAGVEHLQNMVNVIPEVEAELNRLNRDYGVVRSRYEEMLERWENLQTSQHVRATTESVRFRVIDPPFAPMIPAGPDRTLLVLGGVVVMIGAGAALALLLNLLNPVFCAPAELSTRYALPIVGSVHRAEVGSVETASGLWLFLGAGTMLLAAAVTAVVVAGPVSELLRSLT